MKAIQLKDVKRGEFVRRKPDAKKTYTKGEYDRSDRKYALNDWDDISRALYLKGDTVVYVDFEF